MLADATRSAQIVLVDHELLSRTGIINDADFVFVKGEDDRICGIITAGLTAAFRDLTTKVAAHGWHGVDCTTFIDYLDAARLVRNRVMHFGEDLNSADKLKLVQCLNFMRALDPFL